MTVQPALITIDSIVCVYTGNNLTKLTRYSKADGSTWQSVALDFTFDTQNNYYKTMRMPATSFPFWSENNISQVKYSTDQNLYIDYNFTTYNTNGFPISGTIVGHISTPPVPGSMSLVYQCN